MLALPENYYWYNLDTGVDMVKLEQFLKYHYVEDASHTLRFHYSATKVARQRQCRIFKMGFNTSKL